MTVARQASFEKDLVVISDLTTRTVPGRYYIPPKPHEVSSLMQANNFKPENWDMIADVINLMSEDGAYTSIQDDMIEADTWAERNLPPQPTEGWSLMFPKDTVAKTGRTLDKQVALTDKARQRVLYHTNVRNFLNELERQLGFRNIPGVTPLQKSITLMRMLEKMGGTSGSGGMPSCFTGKGAGAGALATKIKEAVDTVNSLSPNERSLLGGRAKKEESSGEGGGGNESPDLEKANIAVDLVTGKDLMIKVARHLSTLSRMQIGRSMERIADPNGKTLNPRTMDDFNSFSKMSSSEWGYPRAYRNYRIVTEQARRYEQARELMKKQCLYMIVDCSGSMAGERTLIAGGAIMRGLNGVVAEDAEMYVRFFDTQLKQEMRAHTPDEARAVMKEVINGNHSGGGTAISRCVRLAVTRINEVVETERLAKPELVVVTDGDDDTHDLTRHDLTGIKLHVILVHGEGQKDLLQLAHETGGIGINVQPGMF